MKMKKMWYVLIPATILMTIVKVYQKYTEFSQRVFLGKDNIYASYITIGIVFLMFVVLAIFTILNKKTAPVYNYQKNVTAGTMALLCGASLVIDIGAYLPELLIYKAFSVSIILNFVFSILACVGMFMLSWTHIGGKKPSVFTSLFLLSVPLWGGVRLVISLMSNSSESVVLTDILDLFIFLFLTLFLMSSVSVLGMLKIKNPVKVSMLYGLPLVALVFTYLSTVVFDIIFYGYTEGYYVEILKAVELLFFALYAVFFMKEITVCSHNIDEIKIIEDKEEFQNLVDKRREEENQQYEKLSAMDRKLGNDYITNTNAFNEIGSPINESIDGYIIHTDRIDEDDDHTIVESTPYYDTPVEEHTSIADALILEIVSGDNDLDTSYNQNSDEFENID